MATQFSRRSVILGLGAAGISAGVPGAAAAQNAFASLDNHAWYFLTDAEARFLAAAGDVLIPQDDFPSASQAGCVDFIDLQLAGPYGRGAGHYMQGPFREGTPMQGWQSRYTPAELFRTAIAELEDGETRLADLPAEDRRAFIERLEAGDLSLGDIDAAIFFGELLSLTNEGYFADPIHGGNQHYAGWEMVGFPGAHAYYTNFVDAHNRPYPAPPLGIAHVPGTNRSADFARPAREEPTDG